MKRAPIAAEPVSAYDAKTHLPQLLERTARGERFIITRHGKPVAQLIPVEAQDPDRVCRAVERGVALRAKLARRGVHLSAVLAPGESGRELAHAGHRF